MVRYPCLSRYFDPCPAEPGYTPAFATSGDTDQLASQANWSWSALFVIKYVTLYQQPESSNLISWKL